MKSMNHRFIALGFMFFLIAGLSGLDTLVHAQRAMQPSVSVRSTGRSRTVVLNRVTVARKGVGLTEFTSIEVLGADLTAASGINNRGQIVGSYLDATGLHGFLLDRGNFTTIDIPGASDTSLAGINTSGEIIGVYRDEVGNPHGFLMQGNRVTRISFPGSADTAPGGINDHGQIVGAYLGTEGLVHGFLLDESLFTTIDVPDAVQTWAEDINQQGEIVGGSVDSYARYPGFLVRSHVFTIIDFEQSLFGTAVTGINARGDIVGFLDVATGGYLGFVDAGGKQTMITFPSSRDTRPVDINDHGHIVGEYTDQNGEIRGFLVQ